MASTSRPIFRFEVLELASPEAGKIALRAGNADIVVSDWLWVSRERALGAKLTFYPYSSALGAVMVPASSPIQTLADLKGRKLAVAGGPIDKNWLLLQAWLKQERHRPEVGGDDRLRRAAAAGGEDAQRRNGCDPELLEFLRRTGSEGLPPRRRHRGSAAETRRQGPHRDDRLRLRRKMGERKPGYDCALHRDDPHGKGDPVDLGCGVGENCAADRRSRRRHAARLPRSLSGRNSAPPVADEEADARVLYRVLATIGGRELVGPAQELDSGTFYHAIPGD